MVSLWGVMIAIKAPVALLGFLMVALLAKHRYKAREDVPRIYTPWLNPEDWNDGPMGTSSSLPKWWVNREGDDFKAFYRYHAIRNPANGLRNFPSLLVNLKEGNEDIRFITPEYFDSYSPWWLAQNHPTVKSAWYLCWKGWKLGFKYIRMWNPERHTVIKLGWRVEPMDKVIGPDKAGQKYGGGAGFATKVLLWRKT
jgi:hypothetical protein